MRIFPRKGCVLLLLLSSIAKAQGPPLTFEQVVELVVQRSPSRGARLASQRIADVLVQQAGVSPNLYLQLQSQTDGFERLCLVGLAISQPIELGHKRLVVSKWPRRPVRITRKRFEAGDVSGMEVTTLDVESSRRLGQKVVAIGAKEQAWRSMC